MPKAFELAEVLVAAGVIAAGSYIGSCLARKPLLTRNSIMLMYEALMHRLVRRHIAGAGFDPTMMARRSVLRDIHGKSRPHTGPCILIPPERPGHECFHHQHVSWGTGCDMANSVVLVGLSGNGTCADNECVRRPLVQLGRVPCFTVGDDAMAANIR